VISTLNGFIVFVARRDLRLPSALDRCATKSRSGGCLAFSFVCPPFEVHLTQIKFFADFTTRTAYSVGLCCKIKFSSIYNCLAACLCPAVPDPELCAEFSSSKANRADLTRPACLRMPLLPTSVYVLKPMRASGFCLGLLSSGGLYLSLLSLPFPEPAIFFISRPNFTPLAIFVARLKFKVGPMRLLNSASVGLWLCLCLPWH
jgi:hypothetical protein